ncbi:MAG TPA: aspartate aminotransferase family protein [Methylomirabilota bacterium]|jgi:glutamate-1-semialdehyde 2,1-aminomutase|nr:aspartate aminotransferase family protein [Methylomirabilota bacterium]
MSLQNLIADYQAKTPRSRALFEEAQRVLPGGNTRTTIFIDPYPFYAVRGSGPRIWDADGHERLDFNGNYTSLILGHAPPAVVAAVQEVAPRGLSFPGPSEHELRLAEVLTRRVPSCQQVRFANSGTEATMLAIRGARAYTGRAKIAKCEGAYHGTHDWVQVSITPPVDGAGSRKRPKPVAAGAGVPDAVLKHVVVLPWNDADAAVALIDKHARDLACVIVEPVQGAAGVIPPADGFLQALRDATARHGIVLIFDEVITFRLGPGGAQESMGVTPDMTTFGKIIGGGLPVGAFGGRAEVMAVFDPRGGKPKVAQGGTFNANPLTMAAGLATLAALTPEVYARLDRLGERLREGVRKLFRARKVKAQVTGVGSLFCLHWTPKRVVDFRSSRPTDPEQPLRTYVGLLNEGVLLSQRGMGAVSAAMVEAEVDRFVDALGKVLDREEQR